MFGSKNELSKYIKCEIELFPSELIGGSDNDTKKEIEQFKN